MDQNIQKLLFFVVLASYIASILNSPRYIVHVGKKDELTVFYPYIKFYLEPFFKNHIFTSWPLLNESMYAYLVTIDLGHKEGPHG